jgi:hypothetical protein
MSGLLASRQRLVYACRQAGGPQMTIHTRELYRSSNGDVWSLAKDDEADRLFVRHQANVPSGGKVTDIDIGDFLNRGGQGAEKQALMRLIGSLITQADESDEF